MEKPERKLRVGVMTNGDSIPDWAYKMLETIKEQGYAEFVVHVKNGAKAHNQGGTISKLWRKRQHVLYFAYEAIDQKLFSVKPNAFRSRKLTELWQNVPKLEVNPIQKKFSDRFENADVNSIRKYQPDILIRLGFRILKGDILTVAPQGIWSYHHADNRLNRGGPAGFWEFVQNEGVSGITLQRLTESLDDGVVIARSGTSTNRFSYSRNRNALYWRSSLILPRAIVDLARSGTEAFWSKIADLNKGEENAIGPLYRTPSNVAFLKLITAKLWNISAERISMKFRVRQWILLSKLERGDSRTLDFKDYQRLIATGKKIWADPFPVERNGEKAVFFEEQPFDSEIGYIVGARINEDGTVDDPIPVVQEGKHASFPFIFEFEDELYMMPETGRKSTTDIYKCSGFPFEWKHHSKVMDGKMIMDTVLIEKAGTWFMFTTKVEPEGSSSWDELHLYYSNNPLSDSWIEHPQSPVVSDPTKGRMAGSFFKRNGVLYRPGQNSSGHYGAGMTISKVNTLTCTEYSETVVENIDANWAGDLHGTHTINSIEGLTMIDAQITKWRWL